MGVNNILVVLHTSTRKVSLTLFRDSQTLTVGAKHADCIRTGDRPIEPVT
jgi:hypothetical protein